MQTLQTIGFLSRLRTLGIPGPFLIVAPLATLSNWEREIARWCPSMNSVLYHGEKTERQQVAKRWFRREYSGALGHPSQLLDASLKTLCKLSLAPSCACNRTASPLCLDSITIALFCSESTSRHAGHHHDAWHRNA